MKSEMVVLVRIYEKDERDTEKHSHHQPGDQQNLMNSDFVQARKLLTYFHVCLLDQRKVESHSFNLKLLLNKQINLKIIHSVNSYGSREVVVKFQEMKELKPKRLLV